MNRAKTLAIATVTVLAAFGGYVAADQALANDWKDYTGKLTAGYAYLVPVAKGTDAIQVSLVDAAESAKARVAIFDASDKRVGIYSLDASWPAVDVASPKKGSYVVYVYEVTGAGLAVRYQNDEAENLALTKLQTARDDRVLGRFDEGGALKQLMTIDLGREPLFVSLLYQGTAENLEATVSSVKGDVAVVKAESGTAYAPGLWSSLSGAREAFPEAIEGGKYTVKATADAFEGTLYLTSVHYKRIVAKGALRPVTPPEAPQPVHETRGDAEVGPPMEVTEIEAGIPYAVNVEARHGALLFLVKDAHDHEEAHAEHEDDEGAHDKRHKERHKDKHESKHSEEEEAASEEEEAEAAEEAEEDEASEEEESAEEEEHSCCGPIGWDEAPSGWWDGYHGAPGGVISVYGPDDSLVKVVEVGGKRDLVAVPILEPGEYVFYLWGGRGVAVAFPEMVEAPELTELELAWTEVSLGSLDLLGGKLNKTIELPTAPLAFAIGAPSPDAFAVDFSATVDSPAGVAFEQSDFILFGMGHYYGYAVPTMKNLVPGAYTIEVSALAGNGEVTAVALSYVREDLAGVEAEAEEAVVEDEEETGMTGISTTVVKAVDGAFASVRSLIGG